MKKAKRILILTGAGAAYPWSEGKVTTGSITKEIRKDEFCEDIYQELWNQYANETKGSINFETIVNAIERIFLYYRGRQDHFDSDFPALFDPKEIIQNYYPLKEDHEDKNQSAYDIGKLFEELINTISRQIVFYDNKLKRPDNEMNSYLCQFLEFIQSEKNCIRSYTTNYDQMFIDATKERSKTLSFFDGFNSGDYDVRKIIKSDRIPCYYNLHGTIYWDYIKDKNDNKKIKKQGFPFHEKINYNRFPVEESNPNEPFVGSPIITGFNKLQRINQEPFSAFSHAFYRDCHNAEIFIFIGLSFNDSHIKNVLSHVDWTGKKILIVDNGKDKSYKGIQNFNAWCNEVIDPDKIEPKRKANLYNNGFENFLNEYPSVLEKCGIEL